MFDHGDDSEERSSTEQVDAVDAVAAQPVFGHLSDQPAIETLQALFDETGPRTTGAHQLSLASFAQLLPARRGFATWPTGLCGGPKGSARAMGSTTSLKV